MADALINAQLRKFSGPFDWVYGSSFEKRFAIFLDKFSHYLDKDDLVFSAAHTVNVPAAYQNTRTLLVHNHDFKNPDDFDSEYLAVAEKYTRRINRVLENIQKAKHTLLVYAESKAESPGTSNAQLIELVKLANETYECPMDLLYMRHNSEFESGQFDWQEINENLFVVDYHALGGANAVPEENALIAQSLGSILKKAAYEGVLLCPLPCDE